MSIMLQNDDSTSDLAVAPSTVNTTVPSPHDIAAQLRTIIAALDGVGAALPAAHLQMAVDLLECQNPT